MSLTECSSCPTLFLNPDILQFLWSTLLVRFSSIFVWLIKNFFLSISYFSQYFYLLNFICMYCVDFLLSFIYLFVLCWNSLKESFGGMPAWEFWDAIKWSYGSKSWNTLKILWHWRCQSCRMSSEKSCTQRLKPAKETEVWSWQGSAIWHWT